MSWNLGTEGYKFTALISARLRSEGCKTMKRRRMSFGFQALALASAFSSVLSTNQQVRADDYTVNTAPYVTRANHDAVNLRWYLMLALTEISQTDQAKEEGTPLSVAVTHFKTALAILSARGISKAAPLSSASEPDLVSAEMAKVISSMTKEQRAQYEAVITKSKSLPGNYASPVPTLPPDGSHLERASVATSIALGLVAVDYVDKQFPKLLGEVGEADSSLIEGAAWEKRTRP